MGKYRYIHGYECQICYQLCVTRKEAKKCFDHCTEDCSENIKTETPKTKYLNGYECIDCLEIRESPELAKACCHVEYPQYKEYPNPYDVIGDFERKKIQNAKDKENEK